MRQHEGFYYLSRHPDEIRRIWRFYPRRGGPVYYIEIYKTCKPGRKAGEFLKTTFEDEWAIGHYKRINGYISMQDPEKLCAPQGMYTLSFLEACNSGKPFRAAGFCNDWYWWFQSGSLVCGVYPNPGAQRVDEIRSSDIEAKYALRETDPLVDFAKDRTEEAAREFLVHIARTAPRWFKELAQQLGWPVPKS